MAGIRRINVEETYKLRHEILRPHQPIEKCYYPGDLEPITAHYGAFNSGELVGILSVYRARNSQINISDSWQLRAMATKEIVRGQGFGFKLLNEAELYASSQGARCVWANSRLKAIGFYKKFGYATVGDEFEIPDIGSHYLVYKKVA